MSKAKKVQGNDSFQRMNYLYQISKFVSEKSPILSSYYGNVMINVAKKNVLKLHPDIKRQVCKTCRCTLVNNVTSKTKIKTKSKIKFLQYKCKICGNCKELPVTKDKKIWCETTEAVLEIVTS